MIGAHHRRRCRSGSLHSVLFRRPAGRPSVDRHCGRRCRTWWRPTRPPEPTVAATWSCAAPVTRSPPVRLAGTRRWAGVWGFSIRIRPRRAVSAGWARAHAWPGRCSATRRACCRPVGSPRCRPRRVAGTSRSATTLTRSSTRPGCRSGCRRSRRLRFALCSTMCCAARRIPSGGSTSASATSKRSCGTWNLPYRVVRVCAGALQVPEHKAYHTQTWFPGAGSYQQIHSAASLTDYLARRLRDSLPGSRAGRATPHPVGHRQHRSRGARRPGEPCAAGRVGAGPGRPARIPRRPGPDRTAPGLTSPLAARRARRRTAVQRGEVADDLGYGAVPAGAASVGDGRRA